MNTLKKICIIVIAVSLCVIIYILGLNHVSKLSIINATNQNVVSLITGPTDLSPYTSENKLSDFDKMVKKNIQKLTQARSNYTDIMMQEFNIEDCIKTELTLEDIHSLPFPKGYHVQLDENYTLTKMEPYYYSENNFENELLVPQWAEIENETIISSGLEGDGGDYKIYTLVETTMRDGSKGNILYINDPINLEFVACSVEFDSVYWLYTFIN